MQTRFASVLLRLSVMMVAVSAASPDIYARHLSPSEALSALNASCPRKISARSLSGMKLSHTVTDDITGLSTVYVFSRAGSPGFCIAAADDAVGDILLGYSDTSAFDPSDVHPGMQWLLEMYSARVADPAVSAAPRIGGPEVAPMTSTMWAQDVPYNDICPVVAGSRTVAGCVAVAVAQAMKVHQWPVAGTGEKQYSYTLVEADGIPTVTVSSDFSSHTYQWADMLDSYIDGSTAAQRDAVALLVYDCGVAASTEYSSSSAARSLDAGCGMLEHFSYDKGMRYLDRNWFAYPEWESIIYSQLEQGCPVIYSGNSPQTGHTFLIDGADGNGFFHFNWGWYGVSDGYYSLADLSPVDPGDEIRSYNSSQNMLVDIRPDSGSPLKGSMAVADVLRTNRTVYKSDTDYVNVLGGFYSFALGECHYVIGLMADTNPPKYISVLNTALDATWGYDQMSVFAGNFPAGEYDVYPVFMTPSGEWTKMHFNRNLTSGHLHFVNSDGLLTVSGGDLVGVVSGDIVSAEYAGVEAADGMEPRLFPGREYSFMFDIEADGECLKEMNLVMTSVNGDVLVRSQPVLLEFDSASTVHQVFPLVIPPSMEPGQYLVGCEMKAAGAYVPVSEYEPVEILSGWITMDVESLDLTVGDEYMIKVSTYSDLIPVEWSSSDANVAEVDSDGVVKAVSVGTASIVASCGGASAECVVTVSPVYAVSIEVKPEYLLIEVGTSSKLDVAIYPENTTDKTVTWTCSVPDKILVEPDGTVTALAECYAELTASCGEVSAVCHIDAFAGIADARTDTLSVTAGRGMVHVDAPAGTAVTVYAADGSLRYRGLSHDIALPSGSYLVAVGQTVMKAIVQ